MTSPKIIEECDLNVSKSTVQRFLRMKQYKYQRAKKEMDLSTKNQRKRVAMCKEWIEKRIDWQKVVFSDEKRFCIDGPDVWMSYTMKGHRIKRPKHQKRAASLMFWGMLLPTGEIFLKKMIERQKSRTYIDLLSSYAVPCIRE